MKKVFALLIVISLLLASCSGDIDEKIKSVRDEMISNVPVEVTIDNTLENKVLAIISMHNAVQLDWEYYDTLETILQLRTTFDVNSYLDVLEHISVNESYVFDYYFYPGANGSPVLYYAKTEEYDPDLASLYVEDENGYAKFEKRPPGTRVQSPFEYSNFIDIDGSREGYMEYAILTALGGQFALKWHANYFDDTPVISEGMIDYVLENMWDSNITNTDKKDAEKLDTAPTYEEADGMVIVSFLYFSKWEGFVKRTLTFDPQKNNRLVNMEEEVVLEYNCGIMF